MRLYRSMSLSGRCIRRSGVDYRIEDSIAGELYGYCSIGVNAERSKFNQVYQQMGCGLHLTTN